MTVERELSSTNEGVRFNVNAIPKQTIKIAGSLTGWNLVASHQGADVTKIPRNNKRNKEQVTYSSGLKNSSPNMRISPVTHCRRILAEMGGVSLGTTLDDEVGDGAGTVMLTTWSGRRK
jgi:hypothetical protein